MPYWSMQHWTRQVATQRGPAWLARVAAPLFACALLVACRAERDAVSPRADAPVAAAHPVSARFVKLEEISEWNGKEWASVAEFNLIDSTGATVDRKAWVASADSAGTSEAPRLAIDGDPNSWWHTRWEGVNPSPPPPHALIVDIGRTVKLSGFRYLPRQDRIVNGTIAKYRFYASADGVNWNEPVAAGDFSSMGAPAVEKTVVFAEPTPNHRPDLQAVAAQTSSMGQQVSVQVIAGDTDGDVLSYTSTGLPTGLAIASKTGLITGTPIAPGTYSVHVNVSDDKGAPTTIAFQWVVEPALVQGAVDAASGEARFVKLEELSEVGGRAWGSIAEFNLLDANGANLPRAGWTASADSADTSDRPGNAIDGNASSFWHTQWDGAAPPPPHSFVIDLGRAATVRGFKYLPRQDKLNNGMIAKFRFYASADGVHWGKPLAEGDFTSMGEPNAEKTVRLK